MAALEPQYPTFRLRQNVAVDGFAQRNPYKDLVFFVYQQAQKLHVITVPDVLRIDDWYHIAAVTGPAGMKIYLNGVLAGEHEFAGSFAAIRVCREAF